MKNAQEIWNQSVANELSPNVVWFFSLNFTLFLVIVINIVNYYDKKIAK